MEQQQTATPPDAAPESPNLDDKILAKFGLAEEPQETQVQPEETPSDGEPVIEQEPEEPVVEDRLFEIKHNGDLKQVPMAEAQRLAQMGYDYEFKMQRVNNDANQVKQMLQAVQAREQLQAQKFDALATVRAIEMQLAPYRNVDWVKETTDDPIGAFQKKAQFDSLVNAWQNAQAQAQQLEQPLQQVGKQLTDAEMALELQRLTDKVPEWKDSDRRVKEGTEAAQVVMKEYGFTTDEIKSVLHDHRYLRIMRDAWKYQQAITNSKSKQGRVQELPKVARPGVRPPPRTQAQSLGDVKRGLRQVQSKEARKALEDELIARKFGLK